MLTPGVVYSIPCRSCSTPLSLLLSHDDLLVVLFYSTIFHVMIYSMHQIFSHTVAFNRRWNTVVPPARTNRSIIISANLRMRFSGATRAAVVRWYTGCEIHDRRISGV